MDRLPCHVVYVHRAAGESRLVQAPAAAAEASHSSPTGKPGRVRELIQPLLDAFGDVHVCATGEACLSKLIQLQNDFMIDTTPTLVLLDTPPEEQSTDQPSLSCSSMPREPPSSPGAVEIRRPDEDLYGLALLQKLVTEVHLRNVSKLVIPVPVITLPESCAAAESGQMTDGVVETNSAAASPLDVYRPLIRKCLDIGAVDIISPLTPKCITTLEICAYKARRNAAREQQVMMEIARGRKRSWVGVSEQEPFAYLREAMVSGLMSGICCLDGDQGQTSGAHVAVSPDRQVHLAVAVGHWHFSAHALSDDELLVAAMLMFKHALAMPELQQWRITTGESPSLIGFLVACRAAYNTFVPYHNFRHVVDVLQATFNFLIHIGALPAYPRDDDDDGEGRLRPEKSQIAGLLGPFEALMLLITAIGHDVGHPGVNNGFLSTLNAPLAQLYNDRSVLESFHCAAYTQILRRHWPTVFEDRKMRNLMVSSILATDMGLNFDYMKKLGDLQDKLHDDETTAELWNGRQVEEHKALVCSLLIKCADISNLARQHDTAFTWMHVLADEFSGQASMEEELQIKSSLMSVPKDIMSLANAQLSFMNIFAVPLFQGVSDILPAMQYTVDELDTNKGFFEGVVQKEKAKEREEAPKRRRPQREGTFSPRTRSVAAEARDEGQATRSNEAPGSDGPSQVQVMADVARRDSMFPANTLEHTAQSQETTSAYKEVNDGVSPPGSARELGEEGNAFERHEEDDGGAGAKMSMPLSRQRCSETTEGSTSGAFAGDWQSQDTSATTGKPALSPSTQGTSIVSNESMERTISASGPNSTPPSTGMHESPTTARRPGDEGEDEAATSRVEGKTLKKRPSRFRMKDFPFFRRNKASPPLPAADATK